MPFLDDNYLLGSDTAQSLFVAIKDLPIVDAHNHANVKEIAANENYPEPWQLFAATDHYVWEVLRKRGVPERLLTGDADPKEKWMTMAKVFPEIVGNPVYEWIHLDLKRYLGVDELLGPETGERIWNAAKAALAEEEKRPQALLKTIGVEAMCSTDDPVDDLQEHGVVNGLFGKTLVRPTWRPDKAMNIFSPAWRDYMKTLQERFGTPFKSIRDLMAALKISHDYFAENGCVASDHGVEVPYAGNVTEADADRIFMKALGGDELTSAERDAYMGYFLREVALFDAEKNWVFQLHIGAVRDVRDSIFRDIGPDSGGDVSNHHMDILTPLTHLLNRVDDRLKVVLYCLDPAHQPMLATMARAFGAKVNLGSAWWLNDNPIGMKRQLEYIGSVDVLANFAGMVSDSRKLLSFGSRFEMFRRVLADVLGDMVNRGQMPYDLAENLAERMSYSGPKEFFNL